jgi:undecaprenyl-diphosphatase
LAFEPSRWLQRVQAEPKTLVGLGCIAGLLLLAKIVEDVIEKESGAFDRTILLALRVPGHVSQPIGPAWLTLAFRDVTSLGSPTIITLITVIAVAYLFVDGRNRLAVLVAISIACGAIAEKLMKLGFDRARPDIVPHLTTVHSLSFPSGHAMLSAITYLTLGALLARAQSRWRIKIFILFTGVLITLLIGLSRVYLGVHWPTDVLAGWTIGSIWALVFWFIAERIPMTGRLTTPP